MDEWVWVKAEGEGQPYRAGVWHLTRWVHGRRAVVSPPCGARAPRWVPWLNGPDEPLELCRGCLYRGAMVEAAESLGMVRCSEHLVIQVQRGSRDGATWYQLVQLLGGGR